MRDPRALLITFILLRFARRHLSTSRLLLAGVALGIICSALMTWAVYFSTSFDLRQLMYWMMGGFGGVDWQQLWLMIALLPVLCWVCLQSQPLNLLALGEISARQLGLPLWLWRKLLVVATGWLVGVSVALAGAIGFIGLVIPHILRLCGLSDHRVLLPACMLAGASALLGGGYHCPTGAFRRRAADWRGDGDAGRAGLYLVAAAFAGAGIARRRRQGRRRFRLTSL